MQAPPERPPSSWTRRQTLLLGLAGLATVVTAPASAHIARAMSPRRIRLLNPHTLEKVDTVYWVDGQYVPESLSKIDYLLRDHITNEIRHIDPNLLDLLSRLQSRMELKTPFQAICGFRSPERNAELSRERRGVAKNSYHIIGQAVDVRLDKGQLKNLYNAAVSLRAGGVGRYYNAKYVHLDTGPVRTW